MIVRPMKRGETYGDKPEQKADVEAAIRKVHEAVEGLDAAAVLSALLTMAGRTATILKLRRKDYRDNALRAYDHQRRHIEKKGRDDG